MLKLKKFWDIDSEILWISGRYDESDKPIYFALRLQYTDDMGADVQRDLGKYIVELYAVGPDWLDDKAKAEAASCTGHNLDEFKALPIEGQVECLLSYGTAARLWCDNGSNKGNLLKEARKQFQLAQGLFGFYMDRRQNMIGSTGWDFMQGNILAGLDRNKAEAAT